MTTAEQLFEEYRRAFTRADVEALIGLFAFPLQTVTVMQDRAVVAISTADEWRDALHRLLAAYRRLGVADASALELDITEPLPRVAWVRVHWELVRSDASRIYDFTALYSLAQIRAGLRIVALGHDERPLLEEALRKRSGPADP